ncbi:MAG: VTT domain-containing protein [Gammaproteobacteria bacterium]|nr:VTT domain-containing protein [Gammaproteobacteria bacterium]MCW8840397.1 VTT domain-containing protein [Gammaproteobacteria bacterium]MCW8957742.1 VTT domain-containing protein [Gammaproteobacteria bacterium]MCW8972981.1 VTT domain-containing protein [Gammaproteobacteria bacterium]MCW8992972.1 VTT domain-containing protein [Gammaproteobacteria bacterium]
MEAINSLFSWIGANPAWAGLGIFLIAFFESLALVGLILPGAAMMFGIGALVGSGALPLWPTLIWAAAGAIAGDGVSFWLGRRYHMRVKTLWPLRNHPELIAGATHFFYRHGGKSILLGRFIGPIRPVIPAVAGMLEMPTRRFALFNILSGVLWAPVYVFPGILFATSLGLASEVASRLAVLTGTLLGVLFVALWLLRLLFNRLHRHAYPLLQQSLAWARLHPLMGEIPASLLDPEHPEARGLTLLAVLLLIASTLFALVAHASGHEGVLSQLDAYLLNTFGSLRTPLMDSFFVTLSQLGEWQVLLPLSLVVFAWLWRRHYHHAAKHWLAAIGIGFLLSLNLRWLEAATQGSPGTPLHSGQLMSAIAVYGFLAVFIARERHEHRRWRVYALACTLLGGIALAQLYLGASRLSGALGAMTLGLAWVALLGIGYRHHPAEHIASGRLAVVALLALAVAGIWHNVQNHEQQLQRYARQVETTSLSASDWWRNGWQTVPAYRADLRGYNNHPLNLQFAGDPQALRQQLSALGWRRPPEVTPLSWLAWLNPDTPLAIMPVLPQVHDGHNETLLLVREDEANRRLLTLRLWPSHYRLEPSQQPLWLGNIAWLQPVTQNGLTAPRTDNDFDTALQQFLRFPLTLPIKRFERDSTLPGWSGEGLLLGADAE